MHTKLSFGIATPQPLVVLAIFEQFLKKKVHHRNSEQRVLPSWKCWEVVFLIYKVGNNGV